MTKSEIDKILEEGLKYDGKGIVAAGILRCDDGSTIEQSWAERDLFFKNSVNAIYEIYYCFYRDAVGMLCEKEKENEPKPCRDEICPLRFLKMK